MNRHVSIALLLAACGGGSKSTAPASPATPAPASPIVAEAPKLPAPPPPAVGHPKNDLIPRSVLFGNPERRGLQISPDGKQLSWLAPKDGVMNVWIAPIGKLDQAKAVTAETTRPIESYSWAETNKHILYEHDTAGDENFHIFKVDLADDKVTDLTPYPKARAAIVGASETQPNTIAIQVNDRDPQVFDLYTLDLTTGARTLVALNDQQFAGFTLDQKMNVRFAQKALPDGSNQVFITDVTAKPPADGKRDWKLFDTVPFEDADTTGILGIAPGGKSIYVSDSRVSDTGGLMLVDIATKKQTQLASDPKAELSETIVDPHTNKVQAVAFDYGRAKWTVLDKSIAADIAGLDKLKPGAEAKIISRTKDDKQWVVATVDEQSQDYYLWNHVTHKATYLFAARPELAKYKMAPMKAVEIPARDGLTLVSYLTRPVDVDPSTPVPMVLLVHGGPWARDSWGPNPLHQLFASRGYAVLSVNYRGSTGFGKKFLNAGNQQWGKAMHTDLLDAVDWATKQGIAAPGKVCIVGGSYGGYATLAGLSMTPDAFACGVDLVGPSNLMTLLKTIPPYWAPLVATFHKRMGDPSTKEGMALLTEASPLTHAAAIKKPLLIGQGANDPRVNQAESEQIVAAMKQHGLPVSYALFPDEGHGFHRPENNIAFFGAAEAFLSAHLGGNYLPLTKEEISASTMQIKAGAEGIPGLTR